MNRRGIWLLLLILSGTQANGQFRYRFMQDLPVVQGNKLSAMAWAGGLNTSQYNIIDLDNDGTDDLLIFNRDNNKVLTFLAMEDRFVYAPEYEHLLPQGLQNWVLLRDYNCDGKQDIFTSSIFGMSLYENVSAPGGPLQWSLIYETIFTEGASGQINLQVSSLDLPGIVDYDGDGDLDIMVFDFALGGGVNLHKNMSVERTGTCALDLVKTTDRYGDFAECTCEEYIFGNQVCSAGGRLQHSGGKTIVSYPYTNPGIQDLGIGQENCTFYGFLPNTGTADNPLMTAVDFTFPQADNPITLNYAAVFNLDLDFDGDDDLVAANNIFVVDGTTDYAANNWFYEQTATGYNLVSKSFLQQEMIDVGYAAVPALADIDGDGDEDLLIGTGDQGNGAGLTFWLNDGDALNPRLLFADNDYLQLREAGYRYIRPQFIDLNQDGLPDLLIGKVNGGNQVLTIYWHTNNPLQPYSTGNSNDLFIPPPGIYDQPYFYFNGGSLYLLVGREAGGLYRYVKRGTVANPQWEVLDQAFLGLADNYQARNLRIAIADMDNDGKMDLLTYDDSGQLRIYADFNNEATIYENLLLDEQTLAGYNSSFGTKATVITTRITGAQMPAIMLGTWSGGVQLLENVNDSQQEVDLAIKIAIYPNPAGPDKLINLVANQDVEIIVYDSFGRVLTGKIPLPKNSLRQLDVKAWCSGIYLIHAINNRGRENTARIAIVGGQ